MKHDLKRKVKNVIFNKTQVLVVLITTKDDKSSTSKTVNKKDHKQIIILGDSMIKHVND